MNVCSYVHFIIVLKKVKTYFFISIHGKDMAFLRYCPDAKSPGCKRHLADCTTFNAYCQAAFAARAFLYLQFTHYLHIKCLPKFLRVEPVFLHLPDCIHNGLFILLIGNPIPAVIGFQHCHLRPAFFQQPIYHTGKEIFAL